MNQRLTRSLRSLLLLGLLGCESSSPRSTERPSEPSPNATLVPAPLLSGERLLPEVKASRNPPAKPRSQRQEDPVVVPFNPLVAPAAEPVIQRKNVATMVLEAAFSWPDHHSRARFHGLAPSAQKAVLQATERRVVIALRSNGALQVTFTSEAFPFPSGVRLQARHANFGHLLVWPDATRYRVLAPGTLRNLFSEGRADAAPLLNVAEVLQPTDRRLGLPARVSQLETPRGNVRLTQVQTTAAGLGGPLLCRLLLELLLIAPSTTTCVEDWVPVRADFTDPDGAKLAFAVSTLERRPESPPSINVPPVGGRFLTSDLPRRATPSFIERTALAALKPGDRFATLVAVNANYGAGYLLLDGVPVAFVAPRARIKVPGLPKGHYHLELRGFFGNVQIEQHTELADRAWLGPTDAGLE